MSIPPVFWYASGFPNFSKPLQIHFLLFEILQDTALFGI